MRAQHNLSASARDQSLTKVIKGLKTQIGNFETNNYTQNNASIEDSNEQMEQLKGVNNGPGDNSTNKMRIQNKHPKLIDNESPLAAT